MGPTLRAARALVLLGTAAAGQRRAGTAGAGPPAQGRARRQLSWTDCATLKLPEGYEEALPAALDAAVADVPDTEPLRKLLAP
ncbi:hypothetical protein ACIQ6K_03740 [Streptomyces sp. NPDC096354]|uniref:hypothetical protein n=1 Tax=Streptomyces sp. NPDC096354 TaxID=3366088 RepID=UPI00382D36F3